MTIMEILNLRDEVETLKHTVGHLTQITNVQRMLLKQYGLALLKLKDPNGQCPLSPKEIMHASTQLGFCEGAATCEGDCKEPAEEEDPS